MFLCKQSSTVLLTNHPLHGITWSRISVLNSSSQISLFQGLMSCSISIEQKLCQVKKFQLQFMMIAIRWINQRFVFKNSGIVSGLKSPPLNIQPEQSEKDNPVLLCKQKNGSRLRETTIQVQFSTSNWYKSIALWLTRVSVSQATWVPF